MVQIVSHEYGVEGVGVSMQGGRHENQDDFGCVPTPLGFLIVVCDGMGGGPGGKTASYIAKTSVMNTIAQSSGYATPIDIIKMAIDNANMALEEKMRQLPELNGMGATLVLLLITEQSSYVAHLGDSRCYHIRGEKVLFRTNDHSLVGELVSKGAMSEEQARTSSQSNVITRGLGSTTNHVAEIIERPYRRGDRFVLCTDGVWGIMPHDDLKLRLVRQQDTDSLVKNLSSEVDQIGFAQGGHHDNHTLVVVEMKRDSLSSKKMKKKDKMFLGLVIIALIVSLLFNAVSLFRSGKNTQVQALLLATDSLKHTVQTLETEMDEKRMEISRLLSQNSRLEQTLKSGNDINQQVNAKLLHIIDSMSLKIDSLNRSIRLLQEKGSRSEVSVKAPSKPSKKETPKELIESCITKLQDIAKMKSPTLQDATIKVKANVNISVQLLERFNAQTNKKYNKGLEPILQKLRSDDMFREDKNVQSNVDNNNKVYYEVQKNTKREINTIVGKLSELNKKLK